MGKKSRQEYLKAIYYRYQRANVLEKGRILDEFCRNCGYNRKYAIFKLNGPPPSVRKIRRRINKRGNKYSDRIIEILATVWSAAGYLCSIRLKSVIVLWLPAIREKFNLTDQLEKQLISISPRQMDRRLKDRKTRLKKRMYGRTKPGSLLKHKIPIRTEHWNVSTPGFTETDLVSHSGNSGDGEFIYSVNQTDILTTWVETRAVLGKSQNGVVAALDEMRKEFPFEILGIDSDNGCEFINDHLYSYCLGNRIQFTRGRPYKKDDNAHIEQKNWTHVRKLIGWDRYDSAEALQMLNDLYKNELRLFMNLFTPSMKLKKKIRIGSRLRKIYDQPLTPLDRAIRCGKADAAKIKYFCNLRKTINPFELSKIIENKLQNIYRFRSCSRSLKAESFPMSGRKRFPKLLFGTKDPVKRGTPL